MSSCKSEIVKEKEKLLSSASRKRKSSSNVENKTKKFKCNKSNHVEVSKSLKRKSNAKFKRDNADKIANEKEKKIIKGKNSPVGKMLKTGLKQAKKNVVIKKDVVLEGKKTLLQKDDKLIKKKKTASLKGGTSSKREKREKREKQYFEKPKPVVASNYSEGFHGGISLHHENIQQYFEKPKPVMASNYSEEFYGGTSSKCENVQQYFEKPKPVLASNYSEEFYVSKSTWEDDEYLAQLEGLSIRTARNIIELFNGGNTIPFIARYRNDSTGNLKPDKLRKVKATFDYIQQVNVKKAQVVKLITVKEPLRPAILHSIQAAHTLEELEFISSPYKKKTRTLAEQAKQLGLEPLALIILKGERVVDLEEVKNTQLEIQHIIADIIRKDPEVLKLLEKIKESRKLVLESKLKEIKNEKEKKHSNYELYGDFSHPVHTLKPHQVLAINRGEAEKELCVKIIIPSSAWIDLKSYCLKKYWETGFSYALRKKLISDSIEDAIKRLLSPYVIRGVRSKLTAEAETEAISVFGANLKQLLLTPPFPGKIVMGIDPGFRNGCKVAIVSPSGDLMTYDKFFLNDPTSAVKKLVKLVVNYGCTTVALGNGVGCRETESLLSEHINKGWFEPFTMSYTIISEEGVSIYSCSPVAEEEFPNLQPTVVSAISLARRLQNPLSELVKFEPKHLGVGMYQHDVNEKKLVSTLEDIVSECVSFVGVDVNSASLHLLKRVAGLSESQAKEIVNYRAINCPFSTREDLKKVKGIGKKTFQQCAGFIRIVPSTAAECKRHIHCVNGFNILDQTPIHPESYEIATNVIKKLNLKLGDLGSREFIEVVKRINVGTAVPVMAAYCKCSVPSMTLILDALSKPKDYDFRTQKAGPIFRHKITKLEELSTGQSLTGVVRNVVAFGAFVDIGIGNNGLIHVSAMGNRTLKVNDRVTVEVKSIKSDIQKVELKLISVE